MVEVELKCTNLGCLKNYKESENSDSACLFHDGKPMFHDIKKGWTCCNQVVYDWDEFQKLKGCQVGRHSNEKKDVQFFKNPNNAVNNDDTLKAPEKEKVVVKDIAEYEKEQLQKKLEAQKSEEKKPLKDKDGKFYCSNGGCKDRVFVEEQNNETACNHHSGQAIFHDLKKYWSCCPKKETWDWDEFMKIPTCSVGSHKLKYK